MSSLRTFRYKEGYEGTFLFSFQDQDSNDIDLVSDNATFAIKRATTDPAALISIDETDPELTVDLANDQISVKFNSAQIALLTPGTYVADFYLGQAVDLQSDTFLWIVDPRIAQES